MAPRIVLRDSTGRLRPIPDEARTKFLVYTDHSLQSFPDVARTLREIVASTAELELLLMTRGDPRLTERVAAAFGINAPLVHLDNRSCALYRLRIMPFGMIIGADGIVRARGLVNDPASVRRLLTISVAHGLATVPNSHVDGRRSGAVVAGSSEP